MLGRLRVFRKPKSLTPAELKITARKVEFNYLDELKANPYWHGGDPVVTHFFNALQALFPEGERFFMDSARDVRDKVGKDKLPADLLENIQLFIRQEAYHGREHDKWSQALIELGYQGLRAFDQRQKRDNAEAKKHLSPLVRLAMTSASEHVTASLAHLFIYHRPDLIERAHSPFRELLVYHALEEVEHKSVCYDLYHAANGGYFMRISGMLFVMVDLTFRLRNRHEYLLKKDGLWNAEVKRQMKAMYWRKGGVLHSVTPFLLQYFRADFHPWQTDERRDLAQRFKPELDAVKAAMDASQAA